MNDRAAGVPPIAIRASTSTEGRVSASPAGGPTRPRGVRQSRLHTSGLLSGATERARLERRVLGYLIRRSTCVLLAIRSYCRLSSIVSGIFTFALFYIPHWVIKWESYIPTLNKQPAIKTAKPMDQLTGTWALHITPPDFTLTPSFCGVFSLLLLV